MAKLTLNNITSGYQTADDYNVNNVLTEVALENTLSRDGTTPNQMGAALDMNSFDINNTGVVQSGALILNGQNVTALQTTPVASANNMVALLQAVQSSTITLYGFHTQADGGGGIFFWDPLEDKANHDGGLIIDPDNSADLSTWGASDQSTWFTAGTGLGCWKRLHTTVANLRHFGARNTFTASRSIQAALNTNLEVEAPDGTYIIDVGLTYQTTGPTVFTQGIRLRGTGIETTIFENRISSAPMLDIDTDTASEFQLGCVLSGFSITKGLTPTAQIGLRFNSTYLVDISQVHIDGLNGVGIHLETVLGDTDGSNMVTLSNVRIENCTGWGLDASADVGFNELSFLEMDKVFIQGCGTNEFVTITNITQANPGVVTAAGHGRINGDRIKIFDAGGMVEVHGNTFTVAGVSGATFELSGTDTTGFTAYTTGGVTGPRDPQSGGMTWKGQYIKQNLCAFTINENCAIFIPGESGLGSQFIMNSTTMENNNIRSLLCTGITSFAGYDIQCYNNDSFIAYTGFDFDGDTQTIDQIDIKGAKIRATSGNDNIIEFKLSGSNVFFNGCSVQGVRWDNFDFSGQTRFDGWKDKPTIMTHKASSQNVLNSTSAMLFNVIDHDLQDHFDTTLGRFTTTYKGVFEISGQITITSLDADVAVVINLFDTTGSSNIGEIQYNAAGVTTQTFPFHFQKELGVDLATRAYEIRADQQSVGSKALDVSDVNFNTFNIRRLEIEV